MMFSDSALDQIDFVLMDADTVPLVNDQYLEIWRHDNYIAELDLFMEQYFARLLPPLYLYLAGYQVLNPEETRR